MHISKLIKEGQETVSCQDNVQIKGPIFGFSMPVVLKVSLSFIYAL